MLHPDQLSDNSYVRATVCQCCHTVLFGSYYHKTTEYLLARFTLAFIIGPYTGRSDYVFQYPTFPEFLEVTF